MMKAFLYLVIAMGVNGEPVVEQIPFNTYGDCLKVEKAIHQTQRFKPMGSIPGIFAWCYVPRYVSLHSQQDSAPGKTDKGGKSVDGYFPILPLANPYKLP